ncbi:MAG: redoxin domain-containing protein [Planctomycetia bacterium]|nr:redoxin domain-containing protein [Planctomycetia bacterium]
MIQNSLLRVSKIRLFWILIVLTLCFNLLVNSGCRQKSKEDPGKNPAEEVIPSEQDRPTQEMNVPVSTTTEPVQPILDKMVKVYREAQNYRDKGEINITLQKNDKPWQRKIKYHTTLQRPNQIQMVVDTTIIHADGKDFWGFTERIPDRIIRRVCPKQISLSDILCDREIYLSIINVETNRFSFLPPPLVLLYAKDPLKTFFCDVEPSDISMLEPKKFEEHSCYRISAKRKNEESILWIDQESFLLRRVELFTEHEKVAGGTNVDSLQMSIDFPGAEIDVQDAAITASITLPAQAKEVTHFIPTQIELLGKPVPDFVFTSESGARINAADLKGKDTVLVFWSSRSERLQHTFQQIEEVYQKLKNDRNTTFVSVNVDMPSVTQQELNQIMTRAGTTLPFWRDSSSQGMQAFQIKTMTGITLFLIDKNGCVQSYVTDYSPNLTQNLLAQMQQLKTGKDIFPEMIRQMEKTQENFSESLSRWIEEDVFSDRMTTIPSPQTKIAAKSAPTEFSLKPLWRNHHLRGPRNILVIPETGQVDSERIYILENGRTVVEISPTGQILNRHELSLEENEFCSFFITAVQPETGKRYFAAYGKRIYVYDENWQAVCRYPDIPLEKISNVIADVILSDLEGDGKLAIYLSFWDIDGIHKISLDGKLEKTNPSLGFVFQMAALRNADELLKNLGSPAPPQKPILLCTNSSGMLVLLDSDLQEVGRISVKKRTLGWIIVNDLTGTMAGIAMEVGSRNKALGLNRQGVEVWSMDLPDGLYAGPIDRIFPVRIKKPYDTKWQWLILGVDSSMHIVEQDGILIDHFNYGQEITGISSTIYQDKPILLISTATEVIAYEVIWEN